MSSSLRFLTRGVLAAGLAAAAAAFWSGPAGATAVMAEGLADQAAREAKALADSVARGRTLYQEAQGCADCHGWDGAGAASGAGPVAEWTFEGVAQAVACGRSGAAMPAYATEFCTAELLGVAVERELSARSLDDIARYVVEVLVPGAGVDECRMVFGPDAESCAVPAN